MYRSREDGGCLEMQRYTDANMYLNAVFIFGFLVAWIHYNLISLDFGFCFYFYMMNKRWNE